MTNLWVLDVLKDLRAFASQNGYPLLAEQLDDTVLLAADEISRRDTDTRLHSASGDESTTGTLFGGAAPGE